MNAESNSGAEPETRTPPTGEAGCETEIDRNVLGTVASTGSAPHRAKACRMQHDAMCFAICARNEGDVMLAHYWDDVEIAFRALTDMLDARSNAEDACT